VYVTSYWASIVIVTADMTPWDKGKSIVWDVTVPDTFTESHLSSTVSVQGAAAKQTSDNKTAKYQELANPDLAMARRRVSTQ